MLFLVHLKEIDRIYSTDYGSFEKFIYPYLVDVHWLSKLGVQVWVAVSRGELKDRSDSNCMNGTSKDHLQTVLEWIHQGRNFGIIRPSDGEFHILNNSTLTNVDAWTFQAGGQLRNDMIQMILQPLENLYIGIPCNHCSRDIHSFYKSLLERGNKFHMKTYANLFCNSSYKHFIEFLKNHSKN